jgi:hypothetical protein
MYSRSLSFLRSPAPVSPWNFERTPKIVMTAFRQITESLAGLH